MNFRGYDLLTQLIPGLFLMMCLFLTDEVHHHLTGLNTSSITFVLVLSFILGYVINGFGHFIGSFISTPINNFVADKMKKGESRRVLIFTKLRHIDKVYKIQNFKDCYNNVSKDDYKSLEWLNQEKKFARSMIVASIVITFVLLFCKLWNEITEFKVYVLAFVLTVLVIAVYRFIQSSIDYAYKIITLASES